MLYTFVLCRTTAIVADDTNLHENGNTRRQYTNFLKMATLTMTTSLPEMMSKTMPQTITACDSIPESYYVCEDDLAAVKIQRAARMYLARKQWEELYVRHIKSQVLRLKEEAKLKTKNDKRRKFLDASATVVQALARGYIIRNGYRKCDKNRRDDGGDGLSLMESIRKRMRIRQKIEMLKQQIAEVRATKNSTGIDIATVGDISASKVELLKGKQHRLQTKAKTLEAVTRPLQEKFDELRKENEKLRSKLRKIESKNESRKHANETNAELLEEKLQTIQSMNDEIKSLDFVTYQRTKAQKRLDKLVESSSAYANLGGMSERDSSAFTDEVARIGREAHRKARMFRDSLRSHISTSSLTKPRSSRSIADSVGTTDTTESTTAETSSSQRDLGSKTSLQRRGHGGVLRKLLRDRSRQSVTESEEPRSTRKLLRDRSRRSVTESEEPRSTSPQRRESIFIKRDRSRRSLLESEQNHNRRSLRSLLESEHRRSRRSLGSEENSNVTPTSHKSEGSNFNTPVMSNTGKKTVSIKRGRRDGLLEPRLDRSVSPDATLERHDGSLNNTPVISNQKSVVLKRGRRNGTLEPKLDRSVSPAQKGHDRSSNNTPKRKGTKTMRRISSETRTPLSQLRTGGMRRVFSERRISPTPAQKSQPSSSLFKLKEELRDECRSGSGLSKELLGETQQPRRKNSTRDESTPMKSPNGKKKLNKDCVSRAKTSRKARSRSRSRDPAEDSQTSEKNGAILRGKRPSDVDIASQLRRHVSLTAKAIEMRKNKRSYLRKSTSLTDSSISRRKLVDESMDSRGMLPHLK